jgi:hypothetical protein
MFKNIIGLGILLLGFVLPIKAQEISFGLKGSPLEVYESSFELVEVVDLRNNKPFLGKIYTASSQTVSSRIEGGVEAGLKRFFNNTIHQVGNKRPIQLRILEFGITEQKQGSTVVSGDVKLKFGYYLKGAFEPVHLVDYEAGMNYRRSINRTDLVEQVLSQGLRNSLQYLNDFIIDQSASDRRLAKAVRVEFVENERISDRDTVFYNTNRKITWNDFKDRPNPRSKFNAAIFTSLALEGSPYVEQGTVVLPLEVKVYMLPGSSWVKSGGESDYGLNHEQRHFDVTRIVGKRLSHRLESMEINPDNYDGLVNGAFFDAFREMNRLQEIYDGQTRHGMDSGAQSRWNAILDQALEGNMELLEIELGNRK